MLESVNQNDRLAFAELTPEEKERRGILGRLYGPCADIIRGTRNGRKYSAELWEKVFNNDLIKEMFRNGGIPGELDHPTDRIETDSSRIAIMMPEPPKRDKNGNLMAYFDILKTPNGEIAYELAKYGFKLGISSRGEGDVKENYGTGEEEVDPDTYTMTAFDLVLVPAVEKARLSLISEGLDQNNAKFKKELNEALNKANPTERKIMTETLNNLKISYGDSDKSKQDNSGTAVDNGVSVLKSLQESLKKNKELQDQVKSLQEKLSVCYAKETSLNESLQELKAQKPSVKVDSLNEQLSQKQSIMESQEKKLNFLSERLKNQLNAQNELKESLQNSKDKIKSLNEDLAKLRSESDKTINSLKEDLEGVKQDSVIKTQEYNAKISQSKSLVEHYKKVAQTAVNKYMEARAKTLGVSTLDIKSKLNENYSFNDIDRVCDSLKDFQLKVNNLPFNVEKNQKVRMSITESKEPIQPKNRYNDDVDDQLLSLAKRNY